MRVPMGLTNAPAEFQRFMENCLFDVRDDFTFPYLDDVIVFSSSFTDHLEHLRKVLRRLREKGIKLNPAKCKFFKREVSFLGRIISEEGYRIDSKNISAVTSLAQTPPATIHDLLQLLGLLGYYRKYVKNFSKIAKPLFDLLKDDSQEKEKKQFKKNMQIEWNNTHQSCLQEIITILTTPPTLSYPDFTAPFILHVDASS